MIGSLSSEHASHALEFGMYRDFDNNLDEIQPRTITHQYLTELSFSGTVNKKMDWIFQANPKRYDISAAILKGTDRNWAMNQHRDLVSVGDRIFFWESGPDAKLMAVGRVASPVYQREESQFGKYAVDVTYEARIEPPLKREEILSGTAPLASYKPFEWLMGTNHPIKDLEVIQKLEQAIQPRLVVLLPKSFSEGNSQLDLDLAIKNAKRQTAHALTETVTKMNPIAFEWLVRAVLSELGYADIVVTKQSNDGGVDLRARLIARGVTNIRTAVQAKRTASVGRPTVQNLRGSLSAHESGLLVTSGRFTDEAEQEAREPTKVPIALIDGSKLVDLMLELGIGARQQSYAVYTHSPELLTLDSLKERAGESLSNGSQ